MRSLGDKIQTAAGADRASSRSWTSSARQDDRRGVRVPGVRLRRTPNQAKGPGQQVSADYLMTGDIASIIQQVGNDKFVYYKMTGEAAQRAHRHHRVDGREGAPQEVRVEAWAGSRAETLGEPDAPPRVSRLAGRWPARAAGASAAVGLRRRLRARAPTASARPTRPTNYPRALEMLDRRGRAGAPNDQLLVLLDEGMVLHAAGRFEESIQVLAEADKLSRQLDFISVSEEAGHAAQQRAAAGLPGRGLREADDLRAPGAQLRAAGEGRGRARRGPPGERAACGR